MATQEIKFRVLFKQATNGKFYCACILNNEVVEYSDSRIFNGILGKCSFFCLPKEGDDCLKWPMGFWVVYYQSVDSFDRTQLINESTTYPFNQDILLIKNYPWKKEICDFSEAKKSFDRINKIIDDDDDDTNSAFQPNYYGHEYGSFMQPIVHIADITKFKKELDEYGSLWCRSYQITDNSIWNYRIALSPSSENDDFLWEFEEKFRNIVANYNKGLYYLAVAYEYADLNARLAKDAYLSNAGKLYPETGGDHASAVAPFIFHSEKDVEINLIEKEFLHLRNTTQQILTNKWRILLVDDKAKSEMSYVCDNLSSIIDYDAKAEINKDIDMLTQMSKEDIELKGRKVIKELGPEKWNCKLTIIKELIEEQFGCEIVGFRPAIDHTGNSYIETNKNKEVKILIEYAENLEDAITALRQKKYDLVLLDYLLRPKNGTKPNEYGYMLLEYIVKTLNLKAQFQDIKTKVIGQMPHYNPEEIWNEISFHQKKYEELKDCIENKLNVEIEKSDLKDVLKGVASIIKREEIKSGPSGRNFFIFISAYSTAVYERLLAEGLNRSEKYWNIAVGACPTNTPKLFLYNLIKLMEKRLDDSGVLKLTEKSIFDVVNKIFGKRQSENEEELVRLRAGKYYQDVLDMHYLYRKMLKDVQIPKDDIFNTEGSALISNFILRKVNLGGLLEHLTQLIHLTAFGTIRQWPEMWEEYIYFKAQFNMVQFKEDCEYLWDQDKCQAMFSQLCIDIEDHILSLKN